MNELTVKKNLQLPVIDVNFDEMTAIAEKIVKEYTSVAITADNYKAAKADAKKIAGYANDLEAARKEIKKALEAPIKDFDAQCKDVKKILDDGKAKILEQTDAFDEKRRKEKEEKAKSFIDDAIKRYSLSPKYAAQLDIKAEYLNLSASAKSVEQDVNDRAYELSKAQREEEQVYQEAETTIKAVNDTLEQKYDMNDLEIRTLISYALSDPDKGAGWVSDEIRKKAASRKSTEDAIREKAKAEALKKAEEEAKKAAAPAEVVQMPAPANTADIDDDIDDVEIVGNASEPASQAEPTWFMAVELIGPTSKLTQVGNALKKLCAEYGVTYNVDSSRCKIVNGGKNDELSA